MDHFDLGSIRGMAFTRVVCITQLIIQSAQFNLIQVPQSKVVPSETKQLDSMHVYTSEIDPVQIDSILHASLNGLLVCMASAMLNRYMPQ